MPITPRDTIEIKVRDVLEVTFTHPREESLRYKEEHEELNKYKLDRMQELFECLLETLPPEKLLAVYTKMNPGGDSYHKPWIASKVEAPKQ